MTCLSKYLSIIKPGLLLALLDCNALQLAAIPPAFRIDLTVAAAMLPRMMRYQPFKSGDRSPATGNVLIAFWLAACLPLNTALAGELEFNDDDTVIVVADRAWEAETPDVVHFSGGFVMQAPDWSLAGDEAVVHGKLDNPDRVVVQGTPARISFLREEGAVVDSAALESAATEERIDGSADSVEYYRATDKLRMLGSARLTRDGSTLTGELIEYDVESDRYSAGGAGGINLQIDPEDD